ncbi:MAG: class I SAM-dependent methyltransferase [Ignavibacteria bacterium]|nr:class I SAM-dependent methyltransferase [Ignavibacteria bacterium]
MSQYHNPKVNLCYFCKSKEFVQHSNAKYWSVVELNFFECKNCGLIFTNPMPTLETIIKGNNALNFVMKSRGTLSQYRGGKEFTFYLNKIKNKGVLLDAGCAEGFFLKGIEDNSDWKAEGVDVIKSAVDFANKKLNIKAYFGTLDSLENCIVRYDFVRMNNIIEHVQNPVTFLKKTNEILKHGGLVLCSTPNGVQDGSVLKVANRQNIILNLLENHFFYYKPKTLKAIFEFSGFEIVKAYCDGIKHSLKDFGLLPFSKITDTNEKYNLNDYENKTNEEFKVLEEEIKSIKSHPSLKTSRIKFNLFINRISKIKIPSSIPVGHQQTIIAKKNKDI